MATIYSFPKKAPAPDSLTVAERKFVADFRCIGRRLQDAMLVNLLRTADIAQTMAKNTELMQHIAERRGWLGKPPGVV